MARECSLAAESGKNPKRMNALRNAAGNGEIDFAEPKHLQRLNKTRIASGTGGSNGQVRAGDPEI